MKCLEKAREMERHFGGYLVQHIPRDDNNEADKLVIPPLTLNNSPLKDVPKLSLKATTEGEGS
jgi:hypothetical protein